MSLNKKMDLTLQEIRALLTLACIDEDSKGIGKSSLNVHVDVEKKVDNNASGEPIPDVQTGQHWDFLSSDACIIDGQVTSKKCHYRCLTHMLRVAHCRRPM